MIAHETRSSSASLASAPAPRSAAAAIAAASEAPDEFERGAFIGDIDAMLSGDTLSTGLRAVEHCTILVLKRKALLRFFSLNPGVLLSLLHAFFIL